MGITRKQIKAFEKQEYFDVLLYILYGSDYASSIAEDMGKTQPTITEQLQKMEELDLVEPLKKGKSKRYQVKYETLAEYVYSLVEEDRDYRKVNNDPERFDKRELEKLNETVIRRALPIDLIADFFQYYAIGLDVIGGKVKAIDEVIVSFFGAVDSLEDKDYNELIKKYKIPKSSFATIVDIMGFESIYKEKVAVLTMLESKENEKRIL